MLRTLVATLFVAGVAHGAFDSVVCEAARCLGWGSSVAAADVLFTGALDIMVPILAAAAGVGFVLLARCSDSRRSVATLALVDEALSSVHKMKPGVATGTHFGRFILRWASLVDSGSAIATCTLLGLDALVSGLMVTGHALAALDTVVGDAVASRGRGTSRAAASVWSAPPAALVETIVAIPADVAPVRPTFHSAHNLAVGALAGIRNTRQLALARGRFSSLGVEAAVA